MRLFVNVDHVATVREARRTDEPDPVRAAVLAEVGGADGITVHLREDRRHIQDYDVEVLMRTAVKPVNLELAVEPGMVELAHSWRPAKATLVPEKREEITTEGGLDLGSPDRIRAVERATARLQGAGIQVSLFIDPVEAAIQASGEVGARAVELHTGEYANASGAARTAELERLRRAARAARELGLIVHAGHGLTYVNVAPVAAIREIEELNIGHSIVSRSVMRGMRKAVEDMKSILARSD